MNKVQGRGKPFDADEKTVIENMPFFLESLALRFEAENCPNLPKLCRAMGGEIHSLQARIELLEKENKRLTIEMLKLSNANIEYQQKALAALKEQP